MARRTSEKRLPTYDLEAIKSQLGDAETLVITRTAQINALELGFDDEGVAEIIRSINRPMFYKSMTTNQDHRIWQDVYHVPVDGMIVYIKFQAAGITEFFVVSFKEK